MSRSPEIPKYTNRIKKEKASPDNIPSFQSENVENITLIGAGAYGKVFQGIYKREEVVLKELKETDDKDIIKQARFHHRLNHQNIVGFRALCIAEKALMLEYVWFDLAMFGCMKKVNSLETLLKELHKW